MTDYPGVEGVRLFNMIEALLRAGAKAQIGKRRVHVQKKDSEGLVRISFDRIIWDSYLSSGRPAR